MGELNIFTLDIEKDNLNNLLILVIEILKQR